MGMSLRVILAARTTVKASDFLPIFLRHVTDSVSRGSIAVATDDAGQDAEATAAADASAMCYGTSEHVSVLPVVVPEHEFIEVERQVFRADVVIRADDATFQQGPKTFHAIRVYLTIYVL